MDILGRSSTVIGFERFNSRRWGVFILHMCKREVYGKRDERNEGIVRILTRLIAGVCCVDMLNPPEKTDPTRPSPDSGGLGWLSQNPRVTLGSDWPTCQAVG